MTKMAISPLRRRMIEDMTVRNFVEKTQNETSATSRTSPPSSAGRPIRPRPRVCAFTRCT